MLKPEYFFRISEGAEEISEKLHSKIVKSIIGRIMLRIGRGDDYILTAQDKWQLETLQQAGYLLEDIQKEIAKAIKLQQTEIAEAMEEAGVKTLEYDDNIYRSVGLSPTPLHQSPELIRIAQRNYEATMGEFRNFTRTMASQSQQLFIAECDIAYTLVSSGALSYSEAVKEVINNVVSEGVKVTYPSGRTDTIETATLRAVRTGISQMSGQIQLKRMEEMGHDKVIISSHLGARPSHHVWQGKVFTVEEMHSTDAGMPAYGTVAGLCGANCRHSFSPYFDFMDNPFNDYDSEENKEQYEKEQKQRTLERRIRDTKREVIGLKEAVDKCKDKKAKFELDLHYQKKSALLSKQNKAYKEYCEENGLKTRADRVQIAKWDRKQASAASGAAKRYKNAKEEMVENYSKSSTIKVGSSSTIAMAKKMSDAKERSKVINEAINATQPVYAEDLRKAYKNVKEKDGCKDIVIHGTPFYTEYEHEYIVDTETLAYIINGRRDYKGDNIRLLSCSTGKTDKYGNCVAQELADYLGVDVYAPTNDLNIHPDGTLSVGRKRISEDEGFKWFYPRKRGVRE